MLLNPRGKAIYRAKNRFSARYLNDSLIYFYLFKKDTIVTLPPLHGGIGNHESDWSVRKTIMLTDDSFMTTQNNVSGTTRRSLKGSLLGEERK